IPVITGGGLLDSGRAASRRPGMTWSRALPRAYVRTPANCPICRNKRLDPAMPRLFTGIEIPPDIGQSLATLRGGLPGARWIDPENYHMTLRFIGDVDEIIAREVVSLLARVRRRSFELRVEDLKSFGGRVP